jgi:hypothetical protein
VDGRTARGAVRDAGHAKPVCARLPHLSSAEVAAIEAEVRSALTELAAGSSAKTHTTSKEQGSWLLTNFIFGGNL